MLGVQRYDMEVLQLFSVPLKVGGMYVARPVCHLVPCLPETIAYLYENERNYLHAMAKWT